MTKLWRGLELVPFLLIAMSDLHVKTVFGKPAVGISKFDYREQYGSRVALNCRITPDPKLPTVHVFWMKNISGIMVSIVRGQGKEGMTLDNPSLIINDANFADSGRYICYGRDNSATVQSPAISLTILGDPIIKVDQTKYDVNYGRSVTLRVDIQSNKETPVRKVFWQLNNKGVITTIDSKTEKISGNNIDNPSLTIQTVTTSEAGNFTCFATHDMGTATSKAIVVHVIGDLPSVNVEQKTYQSVYGEDVTLKCIVFSNLNIVNVYWERVQNGTKTIINRDSIGYQGISPTYPSLNIIYTTKTHIGTYRCFATNVVGTSISGSTTLHVIGDKPIATTTSSILNANFGDSVTLECIVHAFPTPRKIYWKKRINNHTPTMSINKEFPGISGSSIETPSLTIKYATPANEGYYSCFVENTAGVTESKPVNLIVLASLPEVSVLLQPIITGAGLDVILKCSIRAVPPAIEVYWQRNTNDHQTIIKSSSLNIEGSTVGNPSLTIRKASVSMSGEYTCIARNPVGTGRSLHTILKVEQVRNTRSLSGSQSGSQYPIIDVAKDHYKVVYGSAVTLITSMRSNEKYPVRKVFWQLNNKGVVMTIDSETKGVYGNSIDNSSLTIHKVTTSEAGNFTCFVAHDMGIARSISIVLDVIGDLPTIEIEQKKYASVYGEDITLDCNVKADPAITDVYWERVQNDTSMIINHDSVGVQGITPQNPSLIIISSTKMHIGKYRCFASNAVGTSGSESMSLGVIGEKPTVITTQSIVSTNFGKEVTLRCIVNATPKITKIYWYKKINSQNHVTFIHDGFPGMSGSTVETPSLTIKSGTPANDGNYSCVAENVVGITGSKPVILIVRAAIPEVTVPHDPLTVEAGVDVTLNCDIKAIPSATEVYWERKTSNSTTIINKYSLQVEGSTVSDPSLTIQSASVSMSGKYTCFARNPVGIESGVETVLKVLDSLSGIINHESDDDDSVIMEAVFGTIGSIVGLGTMIGGFITCYSKRRKHTEQS
ncbi:immunoglobulin superfamily member 10-like [Mytilus californianus]|uniref:immunoglobulin superfamily member 10-like n=1 Tax=Mytilus californianus TaxID=6549 RepID=UPI00224783ED|nr:immunoglobulin superfamily member 10-like [Mytilus californianus]